MNFTFHRHVEFFAATAFLWLVFVCADAQISFYDSCWTSTGVAISFGGSQYLTNADADMMVWNGSGWTGSWSNANLTTPAPGNSTTCRAIFVGNGVTWTTGGEGIGMLMRQPLVAGNSYTLTYTYVSAGYGSNGAFNPTIFSNQTGNARSGNYIGKLPPVGYSWASNSISFVATPAQNGDTWIAICSGDSGTSGMIYSLCADCPRPVACGVDLGPDMVICQAGQAIFDATQTGASYLWQDHSTRSTDTARIPGIYWVQITNGSCTARDTVTVTQNNMAADMATEDVTCRVPGSASVHITSGIGPFQFLWNNGDTLSQDIDLVAGNYQVTVSGIGRCIATASGVVHPPVNVHFGLIPSPHNTTCAVNNGSAGISLTPGPGTFSFLWNTGDTDQAISNLAPAEYRVTVTSSTGCKDSTSMTVHTSVALSLTDSVLGTSCDSSNGAAWVYTTNGAFPFSYRWNTGDTLQAIGRLPASAYSVTVTDANFCTASASMAVNPSSGSNLLITCDNPLICASDSALICAPGGYSAYVWNSTDTTACFYTQLAGNYYVSATDRNGCGITSNHLSIGVYPEPSVSMTVTGDTLFCFNSTACQWLLNENLIAGATSQLYIVKTSGNYSVQITDSNGCHAVSSPVYIEVNSVKEMTEGSIGVYPNPLSSGNWQVEVTGNLLGARLEMLDEQGRVVYASRIESLRSELDIDIARGVYLLVLSTPGGRYVTILVKL